MKRQDITNDVFWSMSSIKKMFENVSYVKSTSLQYNPDKTTISGVVTILAPGEYYINMHINIDMIDKESYQMGWANDVDDAYAGYITSSSLKHLFDLFFEFTEAQLKEDKSFKQ